MSKSSEYSYEMARAQRQAIYNARVSARVEEFYQRYRIQYEEMERKHYAAYIPDEMKRLASDLASIRELLVSNPTGAREISFQIGSYISGMHSLGRAAMNQFERAERMRQEAARARKQERQNVMMKQYYDQVGSISPAAVHFAQTELESILSAIQSGGISSSNLQRRLSTVICAAEEKAVKWKQEKLAAVKKEAAISRLEETERSISESSMEDREQTNELIERVRRMKEDIRAGKTDADAVDAEIASMEESVEDTLVTEEVRRQTVKAFIKLLRQQDFTVGKPVLVKEGSESYVKFTAQRPSGNRAVCRFDDHGKVRYKFDQYEGMSCLKDIKTVQTELERVYSVKLSDERVLWENPDRLMKDADQIPGGETMARGK